MSDNQLIPIELTNETIESMIYEIRGQKVMLDFELTRIYGYEMRDFNNQVKCNIERFPQEFTFQLTKEEWNEILMLQKSTSSWGEMKFDLGRYDILLKMTKKINQFHSFKIGLLTFYLYYVH